MPLQFHSMACRHPRNHTDKAFRFSRTKSKTIGSKPRSQRQMKGKRRKLQLKRQMDWNCCSLLLIYNAVKSESDREYYY